MFDLRHERIAHLGVEFVHQFGGLSGAVGAYQLEALRFDIHYPQEFALFAGNFYLFALEPAGEDDDTLQCYRSSCVDEHQDRHAEKEFFVADEDGADRIGADDDEGDYHRCRPYSGQRGHDYRQGADAHSQQYGERGVRPVDDSLVDDGNGQVERYDKHIGEEGDV